MPLMNKTVETLIAESEAALQPQFAELDAREERLTARVLDLFAEEQVALRHFNPTNGYGYDDQGRDTLERIYAKLFKTEAAIVRPQIASGTHALSMCLFGLLRPGDHLLSATEKPYDTMDEVIGIAGDAPGSHRSQLLAEGFEVEVFQKGLGELPAVRELYVERANEAWDKLRA